MRLAALSVNLVAQYPYERSVVDGVNVGFEIFRIRTEIGERGATVKAGYDLPVRDKRTPGRSAMRRLTRTSATRPIRSTARCWSRSGSTERMKGPAMASDIDKPIQENMKFTLELADKILL